MAIVEFRPKHLRNHIGFVGEDPPKDAVRALKDLSGYELYRFEESHLTDPGRLAMTGAVIFRQAAHKPRRILGDLKRYAPILLWHDCRVFVEPIPATPEANGPYFRKIIVDELQALHLPASGLSNEEATKFDEWFGGLNARRLPPWVHVLGRPGRWSDIAVELRNCPADLPPRDNLVIDVVDAKKLTLEQTILVRRAFSDCTSIRLFGLKNGRSGVPAFRVFAHFLDLEGAAGSEWPALYFVKIGERAKIAKEYVAYRDTALEHVPYHLGPRLRLERCALGHSQGIIVSDYVKGAETLKDCARDGRAVPVIANLFNSTLRAWHDGAGDEQRSLQEFLCEKMSVTVPARRKPLIDKYCASKSPEELKAMVMAMDSRPIRAGVIHGDLHVTNVLVRGNDAIVIDFEKVEPKQPLLWDMASLEGGLFVDGFVGDRRTGQEVLKSVEWLYQTAAFEGEFAPCHPSDGSSWFFDCVRQIRMHAKQIELAPSQYALVLAVALLKKACKDHDFRDDSTRAAAPPCLLSPEEVRALAYVLSERILVGLSRDDSAQTTAA